MSPSGTVFSLDENMQGKERIYFKSYTTDTLRNLSITNIRGTIEQKAVACVGIYKLINKEGATSRKHGTNPRQVGR